MEDVTSGELYEENFKAIKPHVPNNKSNKIIRNFNPFSLESVKIPRNVKYKGIRYPYGIAMMSGKSIRNMLNIIIPIPVKTLPSVSEKRWYMRRKTLIIRIKIVKQERTKIRR